MEDQAENPGPRTTLSFNFHSTQHYGDFAPAYQGCHRRFILGEKAMVEIDTGGRMHSGTLEVSFLNPDGSRCTAQRWVDSTAYEQVKPGIVEVACDGICRFPKVVYEKSQLQIRLFTYGRSIYQAIATIIPLNSGSEGNSIIPAPGRRNCSCGTTHINLHPSFRVNPCSLVETDSDGSLDSLSRVESAEVDSCAICLDVMNANEYSTLNTTCGHTFHRSCLQDWNGVRSSCPICRHRTAP